MELTKARLSLLVVMTAVFGYLVAAKGGDFSWSILLHMVFGTTLCALGASVFNQLMEVDADARMGRTSDRPLPANRMPKPVAFIVGWLLCAFGLIHLGMKVNLSASAIGAATLVVYLFVYTPMKRTSSLNTVIGGVSGALPPLIGWAAAGETLLSLGAVFLFGLLFLWQMPHFAAINWMFRDEYSRAGFKMWSNLDDDGSKTARIALIFSIVVCVFGLSFPLFGSLMSIWGGIGGALLGGFMALLALRFLRTGERKDASKLFFFTLLYLPLMMVVSYVTWGA